MKLCAGFRQEVGGLFHSFNGGGSMGIRRIVPNIKSSQLSLSRDFYVDFLGLEVGMDMGWIVNLGSSTNPTAQLNVLQDKGSSAVHPDVTVEVDDVNEAHASAVARGYQIVFR